MSRLPQAPRAALVALAFALAIPLAVPLAPALAQTGSVAAAEAAADARVRKLEAEVRALQRSVFPGGDGKFFPAQVQAGQITTGTATAPATTPVTDMLARVDALEAQLARLTAQSEENSNKLKLLEMKVKALTPVPVTDPTGTTPAAAATAASTTTTTGNLAAMTSGASATKPAPTPAPTPAATAAAKPAPKPAVAAAPSAQRVAAVRAVEKPQTADAGDDEYSYGFRLWEAKFQPEAQQQLKLFLQKYPRHARRSYAHNLLGRSLLDEGKPREAGEWFLANYRDNKAGDRAPDSVLYLGEAMRQLKDTNRACIALAQFVDEYPREAAGRLKAQYDTTRAGVKCN